MKWQFAQYLLTIVVCISTPVCYAQIPTDAVADYSFNHGDTRNEAGANAAIAVGVRLGEDRFGNKKSAYYLEGTYGSYLNLGTSQHLKPTQATISLWVKPESLSYSGKGYEANPIIVTKCRANEDFNEAYSISLSFSKKLEASSCVDSLTQIRVHSSETVKFGEWYHVVITYDSTFLSLYVNGKFEHRVIKNFTTGFLATDSVVVGSSAAIKNKRFFHGSVDDLKIYNRVLSPDEITALYKAPNPNRYAVILEAVVLVLCGVGFIAGIIWLSVRKYRKELAEQKEKNRIQSQMYEMEMQMFKAQMNPHFIFNAMNSVQQFILSGDMENAHRYLGKFSKLLRGIVEGYDEEFISLKNEIVLLEKYLEIELLRFESTFTYTMDVEIENPANIRIPQMLIQPFVENAIWHGLLPKKGSRVLYIQFKRLNTKRLCCIIDDNGVGRHTPKTQNDSIRKKRKSVGIEFIRKRLELMSNRWQEDYTLRIEDKIQSDGSPAGTRIVAVIPIIL